MCSREYVSIIYYVRMVLLFKHIQLSAFFSNFKVTNITKLVQ